MSDTIREFLESNCGPTCEIADLTLSFAREVVEAAKSHKYARFTEVRRSAAPSILETIVISVQPELAQKRPNSISASEPIAVVVEQNSVRPPEILALRPDFPNVPHLNLRPFDLPKSLCLWEQDWQDLQLRMTGFAFIEYLRKWLSLTAQGKLHRPDQSLEPTLGITTHQVIIPSEFLADTEYDNCPVPIAGAKIGELLILWPTDSEPFKNCVNQIVCWKFKTTEVTHGIIRRLPSTIHDLCEILESQGFDLLDRLRSSVRDLIAPGFAGIEKVFVALIILLPKRRSDDAAPESVEKRFVISIDTLQDFACGIGIATKFEGRVSLLIGVDQSQNGKTLKVATYDIVPWLSPELASLYSGRETRTAEKMSMIGVGALGSQILLNLVRQGVGEWSVFDDDVLLPHNLCRHALGFNAVGHKKVEAIGTMCNAILQDGEVVRSYALRIDQRITPESNEGKQIAESHMIVDCAASVATSRLLACDVQSEARRISFFMSPNGLHLVMLQEDRERVSRLDYLEMVYYRAVHELDELEFHFQTADKKVNFSASCRSLTNPIPQDLVALNSAISSRALKQSLEEDAAAVAIWIVEPKSLEVARVSVQCGQPQIIDAGKWKIVTDDLLIDRMKDHRSSRLPNETGGVLLGQYDQSRKIIYVVSMFNDIPDSREYPCAFIRGSHGLPTALAIIESRTHGQLMYVGEWHTHPNGYSCDMSELDKILLRSISQPLAENGLPGLLLIVNDTSYIFHL